MDQSTLFAAEPLASHSQTQDSAKGWMTLVATSCLRLVQSLQRIGPSGWFSRTSPVCCQVEPDKTLQDFWASSRAKASARLKGAGSQPASSQESPTPTALPTECWTLSLPEYTATLVPSHSDGTVCSLSDILETGDVPRRYFLSAKACAGILRRAESQGRALPPHLLAALKAVAAAGTPDEGKRTTTTSSEPLTPATAVPTTTWRKQTSSSPTRSLGKASMPAKTEPAEEHRPPSVSA